MEGSSLALNGFADHLFAGIRVRDLEVAEAWYTRVLGVPAAFHPNDTEAVWQLADGQWLYLVVDSDRAGGAAVTVLGDDLDALVAQILDRGIRFDRDEAPVHGTRKVVFVDPDGNEIGFGSVDSS